MLYQTSTLCRIPAEVLENIALEVTVLDPYGPPSGLVPFLCTCKHVYQLLTFKNTPDFYARVFRSRFDVAAAKRRFGPIATQSSNLSKQLKIYCGTLRDIKRGDIYSIAVEETLRSAFFLALESDGKNAIQLQKAGLGDFVDRFVRERLCDTAYNGWPAESTVNAVALWLMWFTTTREQLRAETIEQRQQVIDLVLPYVVMPFRYPSTHAPANHFSMPLYTPSNMSLSRKWRQQFPNSTLTAHGSFPLYRATNDLLEDVFHYDINLEFSRPLVTIAAKMLYLSRREILPIGVPPHLPIDRATAIALGHTHVRPTQADVHEVNAHQSVQMVPPPDWNYTDSLSLSELDAMHQGLWTPSLTSASAMWDNDWNRSAFCFDPWSTPKVKGITYTHGMFNGLWQGRMLVPDEAHYHTLMVTGVRPPNFGEGNPHVTTVPVFMRLREHHCISPEQPIRVGGRGDHFDDGLSNAWLPEIRISEDNGVCVVRDENGSKSSYQTYVPGQPNSHSEETCTSCIEHRERYEEDMRQRSAKLANLDVDMDVDVPPPDAEVESFFASVGLAHNYEMEEDDSEMEDDSEGSDVESMHTSEADTAEVIEPQPARVKCDGIRDMFLTGETDMNHGQAWNHYIFHGRIRPWDGLIALVRVPRRVAGREDSHLGRWVFTGYVVGGKNFVGTWRALHQEDVETPTWESAFCMSRRE
ncbi:hypothetical protein FIBSPDRAFT_782032 [Athelia psychrophila]|uniref:F-box domain-containing protein n=1 Tax=Athelia psychrophila TaxID=1759441 RepID=A0A166PW67_9AGAM|nr:hypothetical protein FIBSPDRAFT_782032 [Fibularhizoctonia sp. CBS 109695]